MFVTRFSIAGALAIAALVSSCAVGPDFKVPLAPDTDRYTREPTPSHTASTDTGQGGAQHFVRDRDLPGDWWRIFHSSGLNALIEEALHANPNLQSTLAALRVANENVLAQQGHFFPTVQANFSPSRQMTSQSLAPALASGENPFNLYTAQLTVTYVLDIWGQNRRAVESEQALADLQRFQVEAAYLTLTSNVVVAAIQDASLRAQIDATNELIAINERMLKLLRDQFQAGYINRSDVAAQEAALAQIRATLPPLRKQLAVTRDLLAALIGRLPSDAPTQRFRLAALHLPLDIPLSLPSQLVEQRPDIRVAEQQLHSTSAQVGVAIANMLPNVSLSANGGYTATQLAGLFSPMNQFWTLAGSATQTVFDGFTLLHQERAAEATYQQTAWAYRAIVVAAFQNVADALRALQNDADALKAARDFERAAKVSLDLAQQQFQAGNVNFIVLLNAQQTYQQARLALVQAQANRLSDTAALFQALGGGWWNREPLVEQKLDVSTMQATPREHQVDPQGKQARQATHDKHE
jgi:NodT family efflux transporter outer membrane factor (OMF) lipoprotein